MRGWVIHVVELEQSGPVRVIFVYMLLRIRLIPRLDDDVVQPAASDALAFFVPKRRRLLTIHETE